MVDECAAGAGDIGLGGADERGERRRVAGGRRMYGGDEFGLVHGRSVPPAASGNFQLGFSDLSGVECERVREAISAELDGAVSPLAADVVVAHMQSCGPCTAFAQQAAALHRRFRLASARPVPDLTERVLAAVAADGASRRRLWRQWQGTRFTLAAVALVELAFAIPSLLLGHDVQAPQHVAHELGSFNVAVAVGLLLATLRPRLATGMLPIVAIIAGLLLLTAGTDLATNRTQLSDETPHLLQIAGFLLLLRLAIVTGGSNGDDAGWANAPRVDPQDPAESTAAAPSQAWVTSAPRIVPGTQSERRVVGE